MVYPYNKDIVDVWCRESDQTDYYTVQSHYMDVAECTCMVQRKLEQYLPEQERDFKSSFVVPFIPYKQEIRVGVLLKRGKKV